MVVVCVDTPSSWTRLLDNNNNDAILLLIGEYYSESCVSKESVFDSSPKNPHVLEPTRYIVIIHVVLFKENSGHI